MHRRIVEFGREKVVSFGRNQLQISFFFFYYSLSVISLINKLWNLEEKILVSIKVDSNEICSKLFKILSQCCSKL